MLLPLLLLLLLLLMSSLTLPGARQDLGDLTVGKLQLFLVLSNQYSFYYKATKLRFMPLGWHLSYANKLEVIESKLTRAYN